MYVVVQVESVIERGNLQELQRYFESGELRANDRLSNVIYSLCVRIYVSASFQYETCTLIHTSGDVHVLH